MHVVCRDVLAYYKIKRSDLEVLNHGFDIDVLMRKIFHYFDNIEGLHTRCLGFGNAHSFNSGMEYLTDSRIRGPLSGTWPRMRLSAQ